MSHYIFTRNPFFRSQPVGLRASVAQSANAFTKRSALDLIPQPFEPPRSCVCSARYSCDPSARVAFRCRLHNAAIPPCVRADFTTFWIGFPWHAHAHTAFIGQQLLCTASDWVHPHFQSGHYGRCLSEQPVPPGRIEAPSRSVVAVPALRSGQDAHRAVGVRAHGSSKGAKR